MNVTAVHQQLTDYWSRAVFKPHSMLLMAKKNKYNHLLLPVSILFWLICSFLVSDSADSAGRGGFKWGEWDR